jgi:hypothetical protein
VLCFEVKGSWRGLIIEDDMDDVLKNDGRQRLPSALTPNIIGRSMVGGTRTKVVVKVVFEIGIRFEKNSTVKAMKKGENKVYALLY